MKRSSVKKEATDRNKRLEHRGLWHVLKQAAIQFMEDRAFILGGALAFFTSLSVGPLVMIMLWVVGSIDPALQAQFIQQIRLYVGEGGGRIMEIIIANARDRPTLGTITGVFSVVVLLFSATAAFAHLQTTMNIVWNIRRTAGDEIKGWLVKRIVSLGMIMVVGFLLFASLIASAVIAFLTDSASNVLPGGPAVWSLADSAVAIGAFALLFATVFRFLPDVEIAWRDVWVGALVTSCFLWLGKQVIGWYLGHSSVGSAYGAAGSLVVFLVWVYYSAILVFFGAEVTQAWARSRGRQIRPSQSAEVTPT